MDLSEASLEYKYRDVQCTADALKLESMVRLRLESFIERKLEVIIHYSILGFFSTYCKLQQSWKCMSLVVMKSSSHIVDINCDQWGKIEQNPRTNALDRNEDMDKIASLSLQTATVG